MSVAVSFHMSVDWRWQRVEELDEAGGAPSRSRDDFWVRRAHKYQKRKALLHVHVDARLEATYPAIHLAYEIHDNLCSHFKWIIEAAVLANVAQEELAEYIALPPDVIEAYEKLFFDVRSKLKARGYVAGSILGPIITAGVNGNDPDGFWKMLAFNGGWEHVKGCWCAGKATAEAMSYYRDVALQQVILKAAASGLSVQPNSFNAVDLMRVGIERMQYEDESGQSAGDDQTGSSFKTLIRNINVVVQDARTKLGAEEPRLRLPKPVKAVLVDKKESAGD